MKVVVYMLLPDLIIDSVYIHLAFKTDDKKQQGSYFYNFNIINYLQLMLLKN